GTGARGGERCPEAVEDDRDESGMARVDVAARDIGHRPVGVDEEQKTGPESDDAGDLVEVAAERARAVGRAPARARVTMVKAGDRSEAEHPQSELRAAAEARGLVRVDTTDAEDEIATVHERVHEDRGSEGRSSHS